MPVTLDFDLVAELERPQVFFGFPSRLELALRSLPEVDARSDAAVRFAYMVETTSEHLRVPIEREHAIREANFRAAKRLVGSTR